MAWGSDISAIVYHGVDNELAQDRNRLSGRPHMIKLLIDTFDVFFQLLVVEPADD